MKTTSQKNKKIRSQYDPTIPDDAYRLYIPATHHELMSTRELPHHKQGGLPATIR